MRRREFPVAARLPSVMAPRRPHAMRLAAKRRRREYPHHTRKEVVFCMLRGHGVQDTRAALRHEGTALNGLYHAPSRATCFRILRRFKLTGLTTAKPRNSRRHTLSADEIRALRVWCKRPGAVDTSTICRWLKRLGLTRKKGSRTALQQDPEKFAAFLERCQRCGLDPYCTVWFDESGFDFRDFRLHYGLQSSRRAVLHRGASRAS